MSYGTSGQNALISAQFNFQGSSAHAAGAPWAGRSALDAVELMDVGWNFRREHLPLTQRSHYVITDGGDQPNVVPPTASVWYYFREINAPLTQAPVRARRHDGPRRGDDDEHQAGVGADPGLRMVRVLQQADRDGHVREHQGRRHADVERSGPDAGPRHSARARAEESARSVGFASRIRSARPPREQDLRGGGSDDIGDVSWNVPTITLRYPANIPGLPGHNWANAISMATPIAHKGVTAGAKVQAMTVIDLMLKPTVVAQAWDYFRNVQTKDIKYFPLMRPEDKPAIWLNKAIMDKYRPEMRKYYYDPTQVQDVPRAARHQVPDGARYDEDRAVRTIGWPAAQRRGDYRSPESSAGERSVLSAQCSALSVHRTLVVACVASR